MDVTKKNFQQLLPEIKESIEKSDYISIDGEFTGLGRNGSAKLNELDTLEERYAKAKENVENYQIIQVGISMFRVDATNQSIKTSTYNFYLKGEENNSYKMDVSSLTFLANNGFDFNKLFKDGLSCITIEEEQKRRQNMGKSQEKRGITPCKINSKDSQKFVDQAIEKIKSCRENKSYCKFDGKELSSYHRKLIYNNIAEKFNAYVFRSVPNDDTRSIEVLFYDSVEEKTESENVRKEEQLLEELGFTSVIKKIVESKKVIIGHCIILDLLHIIDKCITTLPDTYEEFKKLANSLFPSVYDTKLIAQSEPFSSKMHNSVLLNVYDALLSNFKVPSFDTEANRISYSVNDKNKAHDAGFDAFVTGVCFLIMKCQFEGKKPNKSTKLHKYLNKLYVLFSYDIPYMDLTHAEEIADRSNIIEVKCPSTFSQHQVTAMFPDLKLHKPIWVNDTKLFLIPEDSTLYPIEKNVYPEGVKVQFYKYPKTNTNVAHSHVGNKKKHSIAQEEEKPELVKRLKSEDVSQLSNMTLESPVSEANPMVNQANEMSKTNTFSVPDTWTFG